MDYASRHQAPFGLSMSEVMFCWQAIFVAADSCMTSSHIHVFLSSDPTCAFWRSISFVHFRASFNLNGCDSASLLHTLPPLSFIEYFVFFYCNLYRLLASLALVGCS